MYQMNENRHFDLSFFQFIYPGLIFKKYIYNKLIAHKLYISIHSL